MAPIASFTIDHLRLLPGLYLSRTDPGVATFDLRFTAPNREPVLDLPAVHTIEHLGATLLRDDATWGPRVVYFGPMGCRTGFYLLIADDGGGHLPTPREVAPLVCQVMAGIAAYDGAVPGASAKECGNWLAHDLPMARRYARRYLDELTANDARFDYPS